MLRFLYLLALLSLAAALVVFGAANRSLVTLRLVPDELARAIGLDLAITLPLFMVMLAGLAGGLALGVIWEWLRETRLRSAAARTRRDLANLEREVTRLRGAAPPADEILAVLAGSGKTGSGKAG